VFGNVPPTPYDLRFRLFGFPVRVHPFFWLVTALLGSNSLQYDNGVLYLVMWVAVVFVSILVHELGHAFTVRYYGSPCEVLLYGFGGLAIFPYAPARGWRRIAISLAGPAAGFALGGVVYLSDAVAHWSVKTLTLAVLYDFLLWVNLIWNIVNLLPIWPLDGGHVCREALYLARVKQPEVVGLRVSLGMCATLAALILALSLRMVPPAVAEAIPYHPGPFMALWFGIFAYMNYQEIQAMTGRGTPQTW
jgi:stage IV sporulation protein FB